VTPIRFRVAHVDDKGFMAEQSGSHVEVDGAMMAISAAKGRFDVQPGDEFVLRFLDTTAIDQAIEAGPHEAPELGSPVGE
jgi:hypothetical protein